MALLLPLPLPAAPLLPARQPEPRPLLRGLLVPLLAGLLPLALLLRQRRELRALPLAPPLLLLVPSARLPLPWRRPPAGVPARGAPLCLPLLAGQRSCSPASESPGRQPGRPVGPNPPHCTPGKWKGRAAEPEDVEGTGRGVRRKGADA